MALALGELQAACDKDSSDPEEMSVTAMAPFTLLAVVFQREAKVRRERAQCKVITAEVNTLERELQREAESKEESISALQQRTGDLENQVAALQRQQELQQQQHHHQLVEHGDAVRDEYEMRLEHARFEREMLLAQIAELNVRILAKKDIWYGLMYRCEALERRNEELERRNEELERRNQELEALTMTKSPSSEGGGTPPP